MEAIQQDRRRSFLQIHPKDNVLVALRNLPGGTSIEHEGISLTYKTI